MSAFGRVSLSTANNAISAINLRRRVKSSIEAYVGMRGVFDLGQS